MSSESKPTVPIRSFDIPIDKCGGSICVQITEPAVRADNLTLTTWASSFILASQLHLLSIPSPLESTVESIPILELGAGTGLVGLTLSTLFRCPVILTDLPGIVPGLAANITLNAALLLENGGSATCGALDWSNPSELVLHSGQCYSSAKKARAILAADTVYDPDHPTLLSGAILEWLERTEDARVILTYPLRVAYLDEVRALWEQLDAGGLQAIDEGRETAEGDIWDDERLCEWCVWKWKEATLS